MSLAAYIAAAKRAFARYGFTSCPLSDNQLRQCRAAGVDAYSVGCDVAAGFTFREAMAALARAPGQEA